MGGVKQPMPWWVSVLGAAKEWGKAPWELAEVEDEDTLLWLIRWRVYNDVVAQAQNDKTGG